MTSSTHTELIKVGTRGSLLAVSQTELVLGQLKEASPELEFQISTIKTSGDEGKEILGAFVKEVENELRKEHIDLAVHSLKDMPTALPTGVWVACMPERGEHRDCLISRNHTKLADLPHGAKIGTSSMRRAYQLKLIRPDLEIVPIRGNIITRMGKIDSGIVDAVVLAAAGLDRVNMSDRITQYFPIDEMVPAVSQGILALEVRENDERSTRYVRKITDNDTELCAEAEREFLSALGGGCRMPFGAYAKVENGQMHITGIVFSEDGSKMQRGTHEGIATNAKQIGQELAERLLDQLNKD